MGHGNTHFCLLRLVLRTSSPGGGMVSSTGLRSYSRGYIVALVAAAQPWQPNRASRCVRAVQSRLPILLSVRVCTVKVSVC